MQRDGFLRAQFDAEHSHLGVLKLHLVVLRVHFKRIQRLRTGLGGGPAFLSSTSTMVTGWLLVISAICIPTCRAPFCFTSLPVQEGLLAILVVDPLHACLQVNHHAIHFVVMQTGLLVGSDVHAEHLHLIIFNHRARSLREKR